MAEERAHRRLAAILAADVVGYGRLTELDEAGTLSALKDRRKAILQPLVSEHHGRLVKVMGDGVLVEFGSAVHAVACAAALQDRIGHANCGVPEERHIVLRVGINLGDVIIDGGDLYGEGVNVAARLQSMAEAGDIYVSGSVYDQVRRKLNLGFEDLGPQIMKNIAEPVHVYRVRQERDEPKQEPLPLPVQPSIAVLPFTSMGSDADQEMFTDGLTEDLITDLSRSAGLFVIARNSTFAYKGKSVDARRIARDLGVRYLLEGSARRASGRVRINVQLIDAVGGGHLWAERFDRNLEDIFAVQDEVTAKIVEALVGRLARPPARIRPKSMEAYDLCVRARILTEQSPPAAREGRMLFQQAIEFDPGYAEAHRWLALNLLIGWMYWGEPMDPTRRLALETAEKAVALDPNDAGNHSILGYVLAHEQRWLDSDAEFASALELDPNHADAWAILSDLTAHAGRPAAAIEQLRKAFRLNPHPASWYYLLLGQALYAARQYEAAVETSRKEEVYRTAGSRRFLAASLAQLGRLDEARRESELFMINNPHFTIRFWIATQPSRDKTTLEHFVEGFRKAGLPE